VFGDEDMRAEEDRALSENEQRQEQFKETMQKELEAPRVWPAEESPDRFHTLRSFLEVVESHNRHYFGESVALIRQLFPEVVLPETR
jgi:hypothetical protein